MVLLCHLATTKTGAATAATHHIIGSSLRSAHRFAACDEYIYTLHFGVQGARTNDMPINNEIVMITLELSARYSSVPSIPSLDRQIYAIFIQITLALAPPVFQ